MLMVIPLFLTIPVHMKFAKLLHNPGAGEAGLTKKALVSMIQSAGFGCSYSSTKKKGWEKIEPSDADFLILAGGDGTVRKVAEELLDKTLLEKKLPIGLIPLGTANNIAKTLGIAGGPSAIIQSWNAATLKKYDVGRIYGLRKARFFLESFGYGIFVELMEKMSELDESEKDTPEKSLKTALKELSLIVQKAEARYCKVLLDGVEYDNNYLLVEVMNTASIGPNLKLAPLADPGDGIFDVVLITESQRKEFAAYIDHKLQGKDPHPGFQKFRARQVQLFWEGKKAHIDDKMLSVKKPEQVKIELLHELLEFLVPEPFSFPA